MGEDLGSTNQVSETWSRETVRFWISDVAGSATQWGASWGLVQGLLIVTQSPCMYVYMYVCV